MIYIDTSKPLDVPVNVAKCPDCDGELWLEITEWGTDDGEVTEGGFDINCENDYTEADLHSERWVSDWAPVEAKIYQWLLDNVRVAEATESTLKEWNEAVKDWMR